MYTLTFTDESIEPLETVLSDEEFGWSFRAPDRHALLHGQAVVVGGLTWRLVAIH